MNRPRNRQLRQGRQNTSSPRAPATPQQAAGTVPTQQQVVPGASVFIVLKEDQPTGRETEGIVQDVLGRGNHPRGIKVRLQGGFVGRVQRMSTGGGTLSGGGPAQSTMSGGGGGGSNSSGSSRFSHRYTDVRNDDYLPEPPARSLADFMPAAVVDDRAVAESGQPAVPCPFCDSFEGDEAAVTYHIDKTHLT